MDKVLVMDVGNSNIVIGVYDGPQLARHWRITTVHERTVDEFGMVFRALFREGEFHPAELAGVIISSVVPPLMTTLDETCRTYLGRTPLVVGPGMKTGLPVLTENPREVGSDRVVNAVAAIHLYGPPLLVVNLGTATTICVIDERGQYVGGTIAPGVKIATQALYERAAKLPRIELVRPKSVIGRNTVHSMQSGVIYGFVGLVDGIIERIMEESALSYQVVATGGMAGLISPESRRIDTVAPNLALEGLRILWEKNR